MSDGFGRGRIQFSQKVQDDIKRKPVVAVKPVAPVLVTARRQPLEVKTLEMPIRLRESTEKKNQYHLEIVGMGDIIMNRDQLHSLVDAVNQLLRPAGT